MSPCWIDIRGPGGERRAELAPGLTRIGGPGADVVLEGAEGELHLWDDPPKLVHVGSGVPPRVDGRPLEELELRPGTRFSFAGHELVFGRTEPAATLEEIPLEGIAGGAAAVGEVGGGGGEAPLAAPAAAAEGNAARAWRRVYAGMLAEQGLVGRQAVRRWQEAVVRGEFDPDAAARDLLAGAETAPDDPRLLERSGRLLRDFLMSSLQKGIRGAGRRARAAARSGVAMVIAQGFALLVYTLVLLVIALLSRVKWGFSVDHLLDSVVGW